MMIIHAAVIRLCDRSGIFLHVGWRRRRSLAVKKAVAQPEGFYRLIAIVRGGIPQMADGAAMDRLRSRTILTL